MNCFQCVTSEPRFCFRLRFHSSEQAVRMATQYAPTPASLTIISCKYENRQRLQFTTEFAKKKQHEKKHCAIFTKFVPTLSKQSTAQQNMGASYAFFPSNKLTFDLLTLKWCPSHV